MFSKSFGVILCFSLLSTVYIDPHKLGIRCRLNGEVVQNSNTEQLVHKTEALVAFISKLALSVSLYTFIMCALCQVRDSGAR